VLAGGQRKDSLRNIEETGEFTVNVVGEAQFDAMNISSGNFPYGDNEFIHAGLEMVASETVATPRVGGAAAAMECKLHDTIQLPRNSDDRGYVMVIGTITGIHVDDDVVVDGKIAYDRFVPVSRLGYRDYGRVTDIFEAVRPSD
jgi:flavin reductase (DIM6/NTAB) family NADH-FMN oxidoreductase RutF